ncbi:MAG TPA: hypothetical protein VHI71_00740 [Actinomycetota bacterium]|nr:hypothetical protein [Actinomycetota bacterium]
MRRTVILVLTVVLLFSLVTPASAGGGICIPSRDPYHEPPLCVT